MILMQKLEPWLVGGVEVKGGLATIAILAKGLPVSNDLNLDVDLELLKAPSVSKKELVLMIGVFSTANNFERRMALRRSWMQYDAVRTAEVAVRFFIGLVSEASHTHWAELVLALAAILRNYPLEGSPQT